MYLNRIKWGICKIVLILTTPFYFLNGSRKFQHGKLIKLATTEVLCYPKMTKTFSRSVWGLGIRNKKHTSDYPKISYSEL